MPFFFLMNPTLEKLINQSQDLSSDTLKQPTRVRPALDPQPTRASPACKMPVQEQ